MKRFDIYLTDLNPTIGREIKKIRPALIVSPDDLNDEIDTVIIAPMTTQIRKWPTRVLVNFADKEGQVMLDQIRVIDKKRLKKKLGHLQGAVTNQILKKLREIFS
ncbi:MAG: type II toxin-antitoxin system PemK/MazF family toxin [Pseudomonadota bacterium]